MIGQTVVLNGNSQRGLAMQLIKRAPAGAVVNVREANRTSDQNAKMWAMLSDIARAKPEGRVLSSDLWKCLFMAACGHKVRFEPGIDGEGVVPLGFRSSRLSKAEMAELIECITEYGTQHGVRWSEPAQAIDARSDETPQVARPEGRKRGPAGIRQDTVIAGLTS
jgi:hypothetical protein